MDFSDDKKGLVTRLACCVVAALILYYGVEKLCDGGKLPFLEPYCPWLRKNKTQAIAVAAAVLFGLSLALLPGEKTHDDGDECTYQRVEL